MPPPPTQNKSRSVIIYNSHEIHGLATTYIAIMKHRVFKQKGAVVVVIVWSLDLQLTVQSVHITTIVVSSNPFIAIQHYVIKFVSDLRQVGGFLWVLWFPPPIKLTATI
jgi:hypothetical protein